MDDVGMNWSSGRPHIFDIDFIISFAHYSNKLLIL